jgi:hypothetical protein
MKVQQMTRKAKHMVTGNSQKWNHNPQAKDGGRGLMDIINQYLEKARSSTGLAVRGES